MGKRTRCGRVGKITGLGMAIMMSCSTTFGGESPSGGLLPPMAGSEGNFPGVLTDIRDRADARGEANPVKSADAVLIESSEYEWNRYVKTMMNLPDWVELAIENRTRFEVYDHPWRTSQRIGGGRTDPQVALRSRVRVGLGDGPFRVLFEGQDSRSYFNNDPGDFVNDATVNEWDILQLFGSITQENFLGTGLRTDLHFGRLTLDFGKRRLIARNDFRNTTNAFDGVHWQISQDQRWRVRAFLVEPVIRHEVRLDTQSEHHLFWGIHAESGHLRLLHADAYYYGLNDQRDADDTTPRTFSTFGLRLYKNPEQGEINYELESTWQTGTRGDTDHFAHFQHVDVGYTFDLPWSPGVLVLYDYASGDRKPGDSQDGRFDTLFGARRFELMPTGIFGPFFRTNISSPGWQVMVKPGKAWKLQLKQRFWYLAQSRDIFGSSGLRDPTGGAGNYLGHDLEVRVQWTVSRNLDFDAGYDHWFKGSYFDRLPDSAGLPAGGEKDTDYFYISMRVRM